MLNYIYDTLKKRIFMTFLISLKDLLLRNISEEEQVLIDEAKKAKPIIKRCNLCADLVGVKNITQKDFGDRFENLCIFVENIHKNGILKNEYTEKEKELFSLIAKIDKNYNTQSNLQVAKDFLSKNLKKPSKKIA